MQVDLQTVLSFFKCSALTLRKIQIGINHNDTGSEILMLELITGPDGKESQGKELTIANNTTNIKVANLVSQIVVLENQLIETLTKKVYMYNLIGVLDSPVVNIIPVVLEVYDDIEVLNETLVELFDYIFHALFTEDTNVKLITSDVGITTTKHTTHESQTRALMFNHMNIPLVPESVRVDFTCTNHEFLVTSLVKNISNDEWLTAFTFPLTLKCFTGIKAVAGIPPVQDVNLIDINVLETLTTDMPQVLSFSSEPPSNTTVDETEPEE